MDSIKHFEHTYKKPGAHHQEPPPSGTVQLYIQAEKLIVYFDVLAICYSQNVVLYYLDINCILNCITWILGVNLSA